MRPAGLFLRPSLTRNTSRLSDHNGTLIDRVRSRVSFTCVRETAVLGCGPGATALNGPAGASPHRLSRRSLRKSPIAIVPPSIETLAIGAQQLYVAGAFFELLPRCIRCHLCRTARRRWEIRTTGWRARLWMNPLSLSRKRVPYTPLAPAARSRGGSERDGRRSKYRVATAPEYFYGLWVFVSTQRITVHSHS